MYQLTKYKYLYPLPCLDAQKMALSSSLDIWTQGEHAKLPCPVRSFAYLTQHCTVYTEWQQFQMVRGGGEGYPQMPGIGPLCVNHVLYYWAVVPSATWTRSDQGCDATHTMSSGHLGVWNCLTWHKTSLLISALTHDPFMLYVLCVNGLSIGRGKQNLNFR